MSMTSVFGEPRPRMHPFDINQKFTRLRRYIDQLIGRVPLFDSGSASITPSGANVVTSISISFKRAFDNTPKISCQFTTGVSATATCFVWPSSVTTTGFTLNINRSTTTTTGVFWIAIDSSNS